MLHNFANLELTKLLPSNNLFRNSRSKRTPLFWIYDCELQTYKEKTNESPSYYTSEAKLNKKKIIIIDSWTWEDIRLFIKSKGFEYNIITWSNYEDFIEVLKDKYSVSYIHNYSKTTLSSDVEWFSDYNEAREYIIKECLNKIK